METKQYMKTKPPMYSKEWWSGVLAAPRTCLDCTLVAALNKHSAYIEAFVDGKDVDVRDQFGGWQRIRVANFALDVGHYRLAPPKLKQCDVVVYWRGELVIGARRYASPAGIDVARLPVEPTSERAPTLASLQAKTPGFKLLSITRVVVDDNNNLTEYSTKLDNLGRVPF